ncbi:hypothetical protein [Prochlorothrix hollandica]|uniref:hypothetical protein n=1 Tax=Prochlorothrix hollandica TaxID=1223 RepID=UPI000346799C|nr:hypothetical protein [Prochlorothrix hollandica]
MKLQPRIILLGTTLGGILLLLGIPKGWMTAKPVQLPDRLDLTSSSFSLEWQEKETLKLDIDSEPTAQYNLEPWEGKRYIFRSSLENHHDDQAELFVDVFFPNFDQQAPLATQSFLKLILKDLGSDVELDLKTDYHSLMGNYVEFIYQDRAYLTTCIPPQGQTLINTQQQFEAQGLQNKTPIDWLQWLAGIKDLRDWRCIWINISIPISSEQSDPQVELLQQLGLFLYQKWSNLNFDAGSFTIAP